MKNKNNITPLLRTRVLAISNMQHNIDGVVSSDYNIIVLKKKLSIDVITDMLKGESLGFYLS